MGAGCCGSHDELSISRVDVRYDDIMLSFIQRAVAFLRRYALHHPVYVLVFAAVYWARHFSLPATLLEERALQQQLRSGRSVIRFGDGEINVLLSLPNHYQKFNSEIRERLARIVSEYTETAPYVLGIPKFVSFTNDELRRIGKFQVWLPFKVMFWLYFNRKVSYIDAHSFYYDGYIERVVAPALVGKQMILITRLGIIKKQQGNKDMPWADLRTVVTPDEDAFEHYDSITAAINEQLIDVAPKNAVLLFALGPTGKCLAYDFSKRGIQSIDIGRGAEVMFTEESIEHVI